MSDTQRSQTDPKGQFWDQLENTRAVMLGSPDHAQHMQPMAPQLARDEETIWFYTDTDSDLAKAAAAGTGEVHMCLISENHDYHACASGRLEVDKSETHIDRFWSSIVGAWFEGGRDDPKLTMLKFKPEHARVWASTGSGVKFAYEMAKANMTDADPDVGEKTDIRF